MAVFRVERTRDYTVMCNHHLKDSNLSLKAKGLLSMMLSLPDEWNYTTRGLAAICKEGVDAIGKTLKELELAGYIIRRQLRGKDGRISDTEYTIFEKPRKPSPPDTTLPDTENPYLDNTFCPAAAYRGHKTRTTNFQSKGGRKNMRKRILSILLCLVMLFSLVPGAAVPVHAFWEDYDTGGDCPNCDHYHWAENLCDCQFCTIDCNYDCWVQTHCNDCGLCLGDTPYWCEECFKCADCMEETHCSTCAKCYIGEDDQLCGECHKGPCCSITICDSCGFCDDCANDDSDPMHCSLCNACFGAVDECVDDDDTGVIHCVDCHVSCEQCEECLLAKESCEDCGLCALIIRLKLKTEDRANAKQAHHDKAIALQQPHSFSIKDCTSPYSYTFPYCSNNVPCKNRYFCMPY